MKSEDGGRGHAIIEDCIDATILGPEEYTKKE